MNLYFFAWLASILFGVEAIAAKLTTKHSIKNPWALNFFWLFFVLLFTVPVAIYFRAGIPINWTPILLGVIFFVLANTLYTHTLYKLDVSVISPLWNIRTGMAVIMGAIFLNEILTTHQYILVAIIFIFGIFVNFDEKFSIKSFFKRDVGLVLLSMFFFTVLYMFFKESVAINGFWNTTLWIPLLGQIMLLTTVPFFKNSLSDIKTKQYLPIIGTALIGFFGTLSANAAYAENVSISSAIISLPVSMVLAFLFSVFAPQLLEKHTLKVYMIRFASATVMIIAALDL